MVKTRLRERMGVALLLLSVSLTAGCRLPGKAGGVDLGVKISLHSHSLPNGLKIVLVEDHTVPIISYQTWYRVGSVDEQPGITGISHLFEHLMFKGTSKYGPKDFFNQLEAKGADVNAYTTRDYTVYHETFGSAVPELLEKVIDMESDRMANLKLTDEVLASERQVVFEERRMRTDNSPDGKVDEAIWALAFRSHPYRWPVIGYPEDLGRITLAQLVDYYRAHYQPANATVVIVGDIDRAKTLALLRKYYGPLASRPHPERRILPEPTQDEERRLILRDEVASERLNEAYRIPSTHDDDAFVLDVLANILFAGTSSRGYQLLVEKKDVALGVSGSAYTPDYPGLFFISASMKKGIPAARAEQLIDELLHEVQEKGVTDEEIRIAVRQLTVSMVDGIRTPHGLATTIGAVQTIYDDPERYAEDLAKYLKVKAADIQRVAKKYLHPNNRAIVTLVPSAAPGEGSR